jgi:hypothetical protein
MTGHRYDRKVLTGDYVRAGFGVALTWGPLLVVEAAPIMGYILGALGGIFAVFGIRTLIRQMTIYEVSEEGIQARGPVGKAVSWDDLNAMKLAYYSTRRDRQRGWMHLTVKGGGKRLGVDSSIDGFEHIAKAALAAATHRNLALSDVTRANFDALGIAPPGGGLPDDHL